MNAAFQKHGSIPFSDLRKLEIDPSCIIDFSATVNPYPLPESIARLITAEDIASYPDCDCYDTIASIANLHGIPADWIAITAGMTETIFILPRLYKDAILFSPTYGDFSDAYRRNDIDIDSTIFPGSESEFDTTLNLLKTKHFQLLIICNPNNPDGKYLSPHCIERLCNEFDHATICIDESYQELGKNCESVIPLVSKAQNLVVLKSLTKPFGIGGLRAGYVVSSGGQLTRIRKLLLPWGVSSLAQRIIPAIIKNEQKFIEQWAAIHHEKAILTAKLISIGINIHEGNCPFFLAHFKNAAILRLHLLERYHIAVRDCTSFGLTDTLRIMPSLPGNNGLLIEALHESKDLWGE